MVHRIISTFPILQGRAGLLYKSSCFVTRSRIPVATSSIPQFQHFHSHSNSRSVTLLQSNISNGFLQRSIHCTAGMLQGKGNTSQPPAIDWKKLTNKDWAERLSAEAYTVTREAGTEPPFSGQYVNNKAEGVYKCICCGSDLFSSKTKFDSGTGWPSFHTPITENAVTMRKDISHGMVRTEVICSTCNGHLGHVFDDGPQPTGLRFCLNSVSLKFALKKL